VAFAAGLEDVVVNAATVVADEDAQLSWGVFEFDFDTAGAGVPEGIQESLAADGIDFVANGWMQRLRVAFHDDVKIYALFEV
jgi:hypothetical protein